MLILVCMLMRCLRNSEFDRRSMAEAALAMRYVMSREVGSDSYKCGLRPTDLHPHKVGFFLKCHQCFLKHARRWSNDGEAIRVIEISELVFTELYPDATTTHQATHEVVDYAPEEVWCNDTALLHASLDGELF